MVGSVDEEIKAARDDVSFWEQVVAVGGSHISEINLASAKRRLEVLQNEPERTHLDALNSEMDRLRGAVEGPSICTADPDVQKFTKLVAEREVLLSPRTRCAPAHPEQVQPAKEIPMAKLPISEKDRLAAILCAADAMKYPEFAQHLAFKTDLSVEQALEVLAIGAKGAVAAPGSFLLRRLGPADATAAAQPIVMPTAVVWGEIAAALNDEMKAVNPNFVAPTHH